MPGVTLIQVADKEIIDIDYSGCNYMQMIEVFEQAKAIVLTKKDCLVLANFEHTYINPKFMRHAEQEMQESKLYIKKNAFIGMTFPQRMILKGFRLFIGREEYVSFNSREEAIAYLIS